jgi:NADP-dependent aldehyde dehydrogenase
MPSGTFQLVHGEKEVGAALAHHPLMRGIAFTGSQQAGRALFDIAATRPHPIPVFAEMGSVNPVFLFPGALRERNEALAKGFAASLTLGVGQFCTNPGVLIAADGADLDTFLSVLLEELKGLSVGTMLHGGIASTYVAEVKKRSSRKVEVHTSGTAPGEPAVFVTTSDAFLEDESLRSEIFGPAAVIVRCKSINEFEWVAQGMEGQLTATMHFQPSEEPDARALLPTLADLAGRVIGNGWPTGVEVSPAMQHGGPYPATTDSRFTSVGTAAIWRFLRPVCFQDL